MPQAKVLSFRTQGDIRCPVNFKTQEIPTACDQYSISKIVQKTGRISNEGDVIINTELLTEAIKAAARKHINKVQVEIEQMSPVIEKTEEEAFEMKIDSETNTGNTEENESEFELEPVRFDNYSVRRRSRQFYPVQEDAPDKGTEDQMKVPVYNLGQNLKNLYNKDDKEVITETGKEQAEDNNIKPKKVLDYDSDSGLLSKVKVYKPLRKIQSLPEINADGYVWDEDISKTSLRSSRSITDLPRTWKQPNMEVQKGQGPGYAFLASVADNFINKKHKTVARRGEMQVVKANREQEKAIPGLEERAAKKEPVEMPDATPALITKDTDVKPKPSIFSSMYNWGIKPQTPVTNKEMNMYSPISF